MEVPWRFAGPPAVCWDLKTLRKFKKSISAVQLHSRTYKRFFCCIPHQAFQVHAGFHHRSPVGRCSSRSWKAKKDWLSRLSVWTLWTCFKQEHFSHLSDTWRKQKWLTNAFKPWSCNPSWYGFLQLWGCVQHQKPIPLGSEMICKCEARPGISRCLPHVKMSIVSA